MQIGSAWAGEDEYDAEVKGAISPPVCLEPLF